MKRTFLLLLLVIGFVNLQAQDFGLSINYQFLQANQWNKATQVYNFSRPFLENKQPLLEHGFNVGFYYLKKTDKKFSWGPSLGLSFHQSFSENPNFDIGINSLLWNLGPKIQYHLMIKENNNLHLSFTPSVAGVILSRQLNGEVVIIGEPEDGRKVRTLGFGLGLDAQVGYDFSVAKNLTISPTIGINYSPYIWTFRGEVVFNEAAAGDLTQHTQMWRLQGGITLRKRKTKTKS